ncbi:hydrolase [Azospirillum sp. ST 5-10]|uniref:hydrolase n=1 Tax=unclassified Azospirillum TaxID=2630922 RepID=UPI003F4A43BB
MDLAPDIAVFRPHLEWLNGRRGAMEALVRRWGAINSGSGNAAGLAAMAAALAEAFAPLGPLRRQPAGHGDLLSLERRPEAPRQVVLAIHYDTVFGPEHPFQAVRALDADTLNGPGVADAKGGLAVLLHALLALERSPFAAGIGWRVLLNPDEETGSKGSIAAMLDRAAGADLALLYEPALEDGTMAAARKGSGNFTLAVTGRAAHAGRDFAAGRNALTALAAAMVALDALNGRRDGVTVNVARVEGGGPDNVVPERALARFNIRVPTAADAAWAAAECAGIVAALNARDGIRAELRGGFGRPPKPVDGRQRHLQAWVGGLGAALGVPVGWRDTGGCCDGNNLAAAGVANVDTLGVRGGRIHSDGEYVRLDSLVERAALSALLLMALGAGAFAWPEDAR